MPKLFRLPCRNCEKPVDRPEKKYCNPECQHEYEFKEYIQDWKNGKSSGNKADGIVSNFVKKYLFIKYDNKCCKCSWSMVNEFTRKIPLEVHHIDGDYKNSSENNLQLLCPNCHSLTKSYGGANKGKGRPYRYNVGWC